MLRTLQRIGASHWYWLALIVIVLWLEGAALFYQHVREEYPCAMCIHVRLWLFGLLFVAIAALFARRAGRYAWVALFGLHLAATAIFAGLTELSWRLLLTERGKLFSDCQLTLGLPDWFALDRWFPAVFGVQAPCGLTPVLPFGITMAEALLLFSVFMLIVSGALLLATALRKPRPD